MTDANCKDILGGLGVCGADGVRDTAGDVAAVNAGGTDSVGPDHWTALEDFGAFLTTLEKIED